MTQSERRRGEGVVSDLKRVVIKVGSSTLVGRGRDARPCLHRDLVDQIARAQGAGREGRSRDVRRDRRRPREAGRSPRRTMTSRPCRRPPRSARCRYSACTRRSSPLGESLSARCYLPGTTRHTARRTFMHATPWSVSLALDVVPDRERERHGRCRRDPVRRQRHAWQRWSRR